MTTSIERDIENQIITAITTGGVIDINLYTSERSSPRLLPFASVIASLEREELQQFTGIFTGQATITYTARADTISGSSFDEKFNAIVECFYTDPDIAQQMTTASPNLKFYIGEITKSSPRIVASNRTWAKDIVINLTVTSKET